MIGDNDHRTNAAWRTSSYSQQGGGTCVEVIPLGDHVGVRDTKNRARGAHVVPNGAWNTFVTAVKTGQL